MSERIGRRDFLRACAVAGATALGARRRVNAAPGEGGKPNFLIYLSDDHGLLDCSTYGATDIPTPHMEGLAQDGMRFDRAFIASPACAPSRAAVQDLGRSRVVSSGLRAGVKLVADLAHSPCSMTFPSGM